MEDHEYEYYQQMLLSTSVPVIKDMLYRVLETLDKTDKYPQVEQLCGQPELGSFKVNYTKNDEKKETYIVLKICKVNHDLTAEFQKLQPYVTEQQWKQILILLSRLILVIRSLYHDLYTKLELDEIRYGDLYVDYLNSTLYIEGIEDRIGIFIDDCSDIRP